MLMRYVGTARANQGNTEMIWASLDISNYWALTPSSVPHYVMKDEKGNPGGGWGHITPTLYTVEHFFTANGKLPIDDLQFPREDEWFTSAGLDNTDMPATRRSAATISSSSARTTRVRPASGTRNSYTPTFATAIPA